MKLGLGIGLSYMQANPLAWVPAGADWAMDFVGNRAAFDGTYYSTIAAAISAGKVSFTRASTGLYLPTSGDYQSFASGELRRGDKGALLEPAATNGIRNVAFDGAVVGVIGAGGALPTGFDLNITSGAVLDAEVMEISTHLGLPAIRLRVATTASGADKTISLRQYSTPFLVSASSPYNISQYINILTQTGSGSVASIIGVEFTAEDVYVAVTTDTLTGLAGAGWTRRVTPITTSGTTGRLRPYLMQLKVVDGTTGNWISGYALHRSRRAAAPRHSSCHQSVAMAPAPLTSWR